jgi:hypothetical protein
LSLNNQIKKEESGMRSLFTKRSAAMLAKLASILLLLGLLASTTGCANRATASLSPGADLSKIKSFYLIPGEEDKENYLIIQKNLEQRGYSVTAGPETPLPYKTDAVVHYVDKWVWDITPYMLELTITFRDALNNYPLAVGNSLHTSLTRKSAENMVDEVLTNIFNAKAGPQQENKESTGAAAPK